MIPRLPAIEPIGRGVIGRALTALDSQSITAAEEAINEEWQRRDARRAMRERRGGYSAGHRCRSCHRFVSGPEARCGSCGQEHGGVYGVAVATR